MSASTQQRPLARALYDNIAETPDELAFKRGDVITIIEQDSGGLEGWWLCSLRGKQGIAPGNRLKMLTGMVANHGRSHTQDYQSGQQPLDLEWNRRSWDGTPNKVVTPQRQGDLFLYGQPGAQQDYDVPRSRYPESPFVGNQLHNTSSSNKSSREELDQSANFDQSVYHTPPQSRSMIRSPELSMYDTPPSHLTLEPYDIPGSVRTSISSKLSDDSLMSLSSGLSNTNLSMSKSNPASMCDSARSSLDISPLDMYDVPPSQKESGRSMIPVQSSKDSGLDMYDSPPKLKSPPSLIEDYDVPRMTSIDCERANRMNNVKIPRSEPSSPGSFLEDYDVPKPAFHSKKGCQINHHRVISEPATPCQEEYDVPKPHQDSTAESPAMTSPKRHKKSPSLGSLLDDYDTPKSRLLESLSKDDSYVKKLDMETTYDRPDGANRDQVDTTQHAKPKQEHAVDELYDVPKNNAPVKNMTEEFSALSTKDRPEPLGVYDIPPQVTRDSVISSKSDSSDGTDCQRLSTCSLDSRNSDIPVYDELPLDLDAANDLVIKLQQDVQKATNKFSTYVHSSWRKKDNLEQKMYDIKQASINVEATLGEFVAFGQGTLANSAKLSDRKLINKLSKHLIPLQQALQQIRVCIKHLDDVEWQVTKMTNSESKRRDDLGLIASLAKDLSPDVKKLASFIQGNSSLLFKRAKDFMNTSSRNSGCSQSSGKPPINPKPSIPTKPVSVQARPLPAPPPTERPLPPTPTDKKSGVGFGTSPDTNRFSGDFKHWSGEFQVKRLSVDSRITPERDDEKEKSVYKTDDLIQEYDYVQLEDEDGEQQKSKKSELLEKEEKMSDLEKEKSDSRENISASKDSDLDRVDGMVKPSVEQSDDKAVRPTQVHSGMDLTGSKYEVPERDVDQRSVKPIQLEASDRQVLVFYAEQLETHATLLTNSIDAFFACIEGNQPPKVFISNSKFVVVSAHKLVYIGDSLHRNLQNSEVRTKINQCANHLCDCLKLTVTATKTAALQHPSIPSIQDMVDQVTSVSHAAYQLRLLVKQASAL